MTDITKFKSIAIKIDAYKIAKPMAEKKYMSMGAFVRYLIDKEHEQQIKRNLLKKGRNVPKQKKGKDHDRTKTDKH